MASIRTRILTGFEDPLCSPQRWDYLLQRGDSDVVFLTWHWLRAWWETLGAGELLLIAAERDGEMVALAPLYTVGGMVYFLGAGESDYLDFIGDIGDPDVLAALLETARGCVTDFLGFRLHLVLDRSRTGQRLQEIADRLGLVCTLDGELPAVEVDLQSNRDQVLKSINGMMKKRERICRRDGAFEVRQYRDSAAILSQLEDFYALHVARWEAKEEPSQYVRMAQRAFLERFLQVAAATGWPRLLRIDWQGRPAAFAFAWYYHNVHYSGTWCFALELARYSPGLVILRQEVLEALAADLRIFDLGGGDQPYKLRLPAKIKQCNTWGLFPPDVS